jgi:hypothetical protein
MFSGRLIPLWGQSGNQPPATRDIYAPRDSILIPPGTPVLERSQLTQSLIDVGAVIAAFLFITVTGVGAVIALAVLLFVRL